jgi:hypothetical protein
MIDKQIYYTNETIKNEYNESENNKHIKFDDWWNDFEKLKVKLNDRLQSLM